MDQRTYYNLISGERRGPGGLMLLSLLWIISLVYSLVIRLRNICYDLGLIRSCSAKVPVISVGNITTGGTGKTPLVIWLGQLLEKKGIDCAILTRGYRTKKDDLSDEPAMLARSCPATKVVVDPDRVRGAARAVDEFDVKLLVMDDGFQHRRLRRDLDIITVDATRPFGYGRMLPAGLLREPAKSIRRADAVVITRFDRTEPEAIEKLEGAIQSINPGVTIAKAVHRHTHAQLITGEKIGIEALRGMKAFAFCGIGNPRAFITRLDDYGLQLVGSKIYNDHHPYTSSDVAEIYSMAEAKQADIILSTQKDWVKTALLADKEREILFAYLALELEFIEGADKIEQLVDEAAGIK